MKKNKKKNKRDPGEAMGNMIAMLLSLIMFFVILLVGIYFFNYVTAKTAMIAEVRNAIMIVEAQGDLTSQDKTNIENKIKNISGLNASSVTVNFSESNISGTGGTAKRVTITVLAKTKMQTITQGANGSVLTKLVPVDISVSQTSAALGFTAP